MKLIRWIRTGCPGVVTWGLNAPRVPVRQCRRCEGQGALRVDGTPVRNLTAEANQFACGSCAGSGHKWGDA